MNIGVVTEIKPDERRVALQPGAANDLIRRGHTVFVQTGAGNGAGAPDHAFTEAGATIVDTPQDVLDAAQLIVHVKEPQPSEIAMLTPDHILFTYLHLAAYPEVAEGLQASGATCIAYETVEKAGTLPLLAPMSHIAGRLSTQVGAFYLMAPNGGKGVLLGGHAGVPQGQVVVIGAGSAGLNAIDVAVGMGARVTVLDVNIGALEYVLQRWGSQVTTDFSTRSAVGEAVRSADLVVGAVLVAGDKSPIVIDREMLDTMHDGAVVVDISIDQGGCFETSRRRRITIRPTSSMASSTTRSATFPARSPTRHRKLCRTQLSPTFVHSPRHISITGTHAGTPRWPQRRWRPHNEQGRSSRTRVEYVDPRDAIIPE